MKKFFKNPDEAKKIDANSLSKILKKVFGKTTQPNHFFYKAEFEYENGDLDPFMFVGPIPASWKKFIQKSKKDKDFVAGICKLEETDGKKNLLLQAQKGKGSKAQYIKAVNKKLLKKLNIKAVFVEQLESNASLAEESYARFKNIE